MYKKIQKKTLIIQIIQYFIQPIYCLLKIKYIIFLLVCFLDTLWNNSFMEIFFKR